MNKGIPYGRVIGIYISLKTKLKHNLAVDGMGIEYVEVINNNG
jgi:hypothetical protein